MNSSLLNQIKTPFNVHKLYLTQFASFFPLFDDNLDRNNDDTSRREALIKQNIILASKGDVALVFCVSHDF